MYPLHSICKNYKQKNYTLYVEKDLKNYTLKKITFKNNDQVLETDLGHEILRARRMECELQDI